MDWRLQGLGVAEFLREQPGLSLRPTHGDGLIFVGKFRFAAKGRGAVIEDEYEIELRVPADFPRDLPVVFETGKRIPLDFHHYPSGELCLGAPLRLITLMPRGSTIVDFAQRCLLPYLFSYSYLIKFMELPFGELEHGTPGLLNDLSRMMGVPPNVARGLLTIAERQRRKANRSACPCRSGRRLGACHHRIVNQLRELIGRLGCRYLDRLLRSGSRRKEPSIKATAL